VSSSGVKGATAFQKAENLLELIDQANRAGSGSSESATARQISWRAAGILAAGTRWLQGQVTGPAPLAATPRNKFSYGQAPDDDEAP
jgi:hypothetical protein